MCSSDLAVAAGGHSCAGGGNASGQLGVGGAGSDILAPRPVEGGLQGQELLDLDAGALHVLALTVDGVVWVCGDNTDGKLGLGGAEAPGGGQGNPKPPLDHAPAYGRKSQLHSGS